MVHSIDTIILKLASRCNLNCTYCYEYNMGDNSWMNDPSYLSEELALKVGERIQEYNSSNNKFFVNFHGGEPLLIGSEKIIKIAELIKSVKGNKKIYFGIQTNGTLLKNDDIKLFNDNKISIGISVDGHFNANERRITHSGKSSFDKVVSTVNKIKDLKIWSGFLCVINLKYEPEKILDFLSDFNPPKIDFLPLFGNYANPPKDDGKIMEFGEWITRMYDYWNSKPSLQKIKIKYLEDAMKSIITNRSDSDWFGIEPPGYVVVTTGGNYEGLDTLKVGDRDERRLGMNIKNHTLEDVQKHDHSIMRSSGIDQLANDCLQCEIKSWCNGGYIATRYSKENGYKNPSLYCKDHKQMFSHIYNHLVRNNYIEK